MNRFPTIIFDLDGTLIHSVPDIQAAMNTVLTALERPLLNEQQAASFVGNGVETFVARALDATGGNVPSFNALAMFLAEYEADPSSRTKPYLGVVARLQQLKEQGVRMAICTNKPTAPAKLICDALDLTQYFEVIAGSEPEIAKKPDPMPLLRVITALGGTPEQTLYVGDSTVDQATAQNANVPFAFFTGGYLNGDLTVPMPDITFDDWSDAWLQSEK